MPFYFLYSHFPILSFQGVAADSESPLGNKKTKTRALPGVYISYALTKKKIVGSPQCNATRTPFNLPFPKSQLY